MRYTVTVMLPVGNSRTNLSADPLDTVVVCTGFYSDLSFLVDGEAKITIIFKEKISVSRNWLRWT